MKPTAESSTDDERAIRGLLRRYHAAMVDARTGDLDALLDRGFALVHITGYVQPKAEWLSVIRSGAFEYHGFNIDERTLAVRVTGNTAAATGRGVFDATIHGTRRSWRLRFDTQLAKRDGAWIVRHVRYTTF